MTLQEQFINDLISSNNNSEITAKEIRNWYSEVKNGKSLYSYPSTIYTLVIDPLVVKGLLIRVKKGVYRFNKEAVQEKRIKIIKATTVTTATATVENENDISESELDDWDLYIQSKIKGD